MITNPDFDPLKLLHDLMDHVINQDQTINDLVKHINDLTDRVTELEDLINEQ